MIWRISSVGGQTENGDKNLLMSVLHFCESIPSSRLFFLTWSKNVWRSFIHFLYFSTDDLSIIFILFSLPYCRFAEPSGNARHRLDWNCLSRPVIMQLIRVPVHRVSVVSWIECRRTQRILWCYRALIVSCHNRRPQCLPPNCITNMRCRVDWPHCRTIICTGHQHHLHMPCRQPIHSCHSAVAAQAVYWAIYAERLYRPRLDRPKTKFRQSHKRPPLQPMMKNLTSKCSGRRRRWPTLGDIWNSLSASRFRPIYRE